MYSMFKSRQGVSYHPEAGLWLPVAGEGGRGCDSSFCGCWSHSVSDVAAGFTNVDIL